MCLLTDIPDIKRWHNLRNYTYVVIGNGTHLYQDDDFMLFYIVDVFQDKTMIMLEIIHTPSTPQVVICICILW